MSKVSNTAYINKHIKNLTAYQECRAALKSGKRMLSVNGLTGSACAAVLMALYSDIHCPLCIVTTTSRYADSVITDLGIFGALSENPVTPVLFPEREVLPYEKISPHTALLHERMRTLYTVLNKNAPIVIATARSFSAATLPHSEFQRHCYTLPDDVLSYDALQEILAYTGYRTADTVRAVGEYAVRGGIIDVWSPAADRPVRIDFFGDEIESLRFFNPVTQLSETPCQHLSIIPANELILTEENRNRARVKIEKYTADTDTVLMRKISEELYWEGQEHYLPIYYSAVECLLDYLPDNTIVVYNDYRTIGFKMGHIRAEVEHLYEQASRHQGFQPSPDSVMFSMDELQKRKKIVSMHVSHLPEDIHHGGIHFSVRENPHYKRNLRRLKKDIRVSLDDEYMIYIVAGHCGALQRLRQIIINDNFTHHEIIESATNNGGNNCSPVSEESRINENEVTFYEARLGNGFIFPEIKLQILLDVEIFGKIRVPRRSIKHTDRQEVLSSFLDLKKNDYVVHINHGIGIFHGLVKKKTDNRMQDYILVRYAGEDKLYVPLDQINLLQRYIGEDGTPPTLDKLGHISWQRVQVRVRKNVLKMARELLELYTIRDKLPGHAFQPDTPWQHTFEADFEFEETEDQMRAIEEVKQDMEKTKPMDRLVCGDVGFGKTEVALRAAFKTVMEGKQVALLVPTTILAQQHYHTFSERFEMFPVKVAMLSRFCSRRQQKTILDGMRSGNYDIIIGTHRLMSHDVVFKDLGLVIIDEEQRFGVQHKERLKSYRKLVDVLSMSATPIPRTLHLSLLGIRDISLITTPPDERIPIQTYITEFNDMIISDAVRRELDRDGQILFIHNRVETIESMAHYLQELIPESVIAVGHGQLPEKQLEQVMNEFIARKYDILLCTTIIESGMDIPNCNTIIINNAHAFGLAQLYQLRGRVGRSKRRAFAYLLFPADTMLTEIQKKRLQVINDFTDLGSGYKVALQDLEIRGGGNIFGPQQHGDVLSIGLDMYCRLLDTTVKELKGMKVKEAKEPLMNFHYEAFIPDDYITASKQKINIYKRIMKAASRSELESLAQELIDRFGVMPFSVEQVFLLRETKLLAMALGIISVQQSDDGMIIEFKKDTVNDNAEKSAPLLSETVAEKLLTYIQAHPDRLTFNPDKPHLLLVSYAMIGYNRIAGLKKVLQNLF